MASLLRTYLTRALACVWATAGLGLALSAALGLGDGLPSFSILVLAVGSAVLIAGFSQVRFEFRHRDHGVDVSLDAAFAVLAALVLAPPVAAAVALAAGLFAFRNKPAWRQLYEASSQALAVGLGGLAVQAWVSTDPSGRLVLPAALLAAAIRNTTDLTGTLLLEEVRERGGARDVIRRAPLLAIFLLDASLPVAACAMAGPFLGSPIQAFAVTAGASGLVWVVLRLLHAQHTQSVQNDYLRDTVSRYMPLPVAEQLLEHSTELELGGEQVEITVLFCDIRGFTAWAEKNQPDDVIAELNLLLTDLSESVLANGGTLDKFTGDGLMAFWGAPAAQLDHAERALKSVPQMLMRVREFNVRRERQGQPALEVGIGVNSGLAMVGNVGHRDRLNYTAVGDTVNTAARLEQATKQFDCPLLISEGTFLGLPLNMQRQLVRISSVEVKGRRDRVRLYTLISLARYSMKLTAKDPAERASGEDPAGAHAI